jgi:FAD synthase
MHKLRSEAKFESLEALKAQIARDVAEVRAYFTNPAGKTHG